MGRMRVFWNASISVAPASFLQKNNCADSPVSSATDPSFDLIPPVAKTSHELAQTCLIS